MTFLYYFRGNNVTKSNSNIDEEIVTFNEIYKSRIHQYWSVIMEIPIEIGIAVALASFVIGALLTGMLRCIRYKKLTPEKGPLRNGDILDSSTEGSEIQSMRSSPEHTQDHHISKLTP